MNRFTSSLRRLGWLALAAAAVLLIAAPVQAQKTSGAIHGTVVNEAGPAAGVSVVAVNAESGFARDTTTDAKGAFAMLGLAPGTWELIVTADGFQEQRVSLPVLLGQDVAVEVRLQPATVVSEQIEVVAEATQAQINTRSSEIGTNITTQQIESLPQGNRNFLAFAGLAPGISFTRDQDAQGQGFSSSGENAKQVNVFIDGLSYKNDIIKGGAFMQDSSRGNPFPQAAVQEYKVLTGNFKAEYEKAAAAVITAVTRSGGNSFQGDVFFYDQTKSMVTQDKISKDRGDDKPDYKRQQYGLSFGGPIVKDKLHFFATFERNKQDRAAFVFRGSAFDGAPANVRNFLSQYKTGTVTVPFDEKLYFGKLSWQPAAAQSMDFSYHRRDEEEVRGFGGQRVEQGAERMEVKTDAAVLKHQWVMGKGLNESALTWQKMEWNPTALDLDTPHQNYEGLLDIGGKDSTQNLAQEKLAFRDDFSYMLDWHGAHTLKAGLTAARADYDYKRLNDYNPTFSFRALEEWQYPYSARIGYGDPQAAFGNNQYGLYLQDDWQLLDNLTLNIGVRWDYETNMVNNGYRTPQAIADGLRTGCTDFGYTVGGRSTWCFRDLFDVEKYISDGNNRSSYKGMYQPRLGFTWDVTGKGETVIFGGWGKYYDRVALNDVVDEKFKQSYKTYSFCFSADGGPVSSCGGQVFQWNPSYLSRQGLVNLITSGQAGGEVFLLANDTRPPYTNQWSLGLRQRLGTWNASLSYANVKGYNGLAWSWAGQPPGAQWDRRWEHVSIPGYAGIFRSYDLRRTWYEGYFLTVDRPYTAMSKWGFNFAYTYSEGWWEASGDEGTAFAFDFPINGWDRYRFHANGDERHKVVMSGTVGLPAGFVVSSVISLGSGTPYAQPDASRGWGDGTTYGAGFVYRYNAVYPKKYSFIIPNAWAYRSVDLRLDWEAPKIADRVRITLVGECLNVFNYANYSYDPWYSFVLLPNGEVNQNANKPSAAFNARRYQVGLRVGF